MKTITSAEAFNKLPQRLLNFFIKFPPRPFASYSDKPLTVQSENMNPFLPNKNEETGRWHEASYSRRRAAELFKLAYKFGVHDLLPPIPYRKFYEDKFYNKKWMRGVLNHKKHKWERGLEAKLQIKKEAISKMDETIIAARPRYKKQIKKREERERKWW